MDGKYDCARCGREVIYHGSDDIHMCFNGELDDGAQYICASCAKEQLIIHDKYIKELKSWWNYKGSK